MDNSGWEYDPFDKYLDDMFGKVRNESMWGDDYSRIRSKVFGPLPEFNFDVGDNTWNRTLREIRKLPTTYLCPIEER